jgi:hypothetical protein
MKNIKLNKKIIIPMIMGALAIGSLTSPVYADPSGADNEYQIIIIEKDPNTGKYVQKITYTEHAYFGTTGFCDICGETINVGNHINKLIKDPNKGVVLGKDSEDGIPVIPEDDEDKGVVLPKDPNEGEGIPEIPEADEIENDKGVVLGKNEESGIPEISENTLTVKLNGDVFTIDCASGTYKEVFDYFKKLGYKDFTVRNYWGTQVFHWYNFDSKKVCSVFLK